MQSELVEDNEQGISTGSTVNKLDNIYFIRTMVINLLINLILLSTYHSFVPSKLTN